LTGVRLLLYAPKVAYIGGIALTARSRRRTAVKASASRPKARRQIEDLALHYLGDLAFEVILNRGYAAKAAEVAAAIGAVEVGPKLVRRTMANSPRFAQEDRRWNIAVRHYGDRPLEGAVEQTLRAYGRPIPLSLLCNEMSLSQNNPLSPDEYRRLLPKIVGTRKRYFVTSDERVGLSEWLLDTEVGDDEEFMLRNFFMAEEDTLQLLEKLSRSSASPDQPEGRLALHLLRTAGEPLPNRLLSAAIWRLKDRKADPVRLFEALEADEDLLLLSEGLWLPASQKEEIDRVLQRLSRQADKEEAELEEALEAEALALTDSDRTEIRARLEQEGHPLRASLIAEAVFEINPASRSFPLAIQAVNDGLGQDPAVRRAGKQTWALPSQVPAEIEEIPESLFVNSIDPARLPDAEADWELEDAGLEPGLPDMVHDPRYEDFGEEDEIEAIEATKPQARVTPIPISLLYTHWKAGTLKIREIDRNLFPEESQLIYAVMHPEGGEPFAAWINQFTTLVYGLTPWYERVGAAPGSIIILKPGDQDDDFNIALTDRTDPLLEIEPERIQHLESLRGEAETVPWSVFDIMRRVLQQHPRGLRFIRLWAEVNVVRRTTRRVVASDLSCYHCFYSRPAGSDTWAFDERRLDQGVRKTKRKFARR